MLAHDLGYLSDTEYKEIYEKENEAGKLLAGWIRSQNPIRLNP